MEISPIFVTQVNHMYHTTVDQQIHKKREHRSSINMTNFMDTSPDILLGAYLMSHLRSACENCGTTNTPQWRKGWFSEILNRSVLLCNACGIKYAKKQYCPHCNYIYGKEIDRQSDAWLVCSVCSRWVHMECERLHLEGQNIMDVERKIHPFSLNRNYLCPGCVSNPIPVGLVEEKNLKKPN